MKRFLKAVGVLVTVAAICAAGVVGYLYVSEHSRPQETMRERKVVQVRTIAVQAGPIERTILLTGEVRATQSVEVKPKISGRLERLALDDGTAVVEGTAVKAGQVIAVLEHRDLQAQVAQAAAALETAKAAVETAKAAVEAEKAAGAAVEVMLADRNREMQRMESLYKQGSATEKQRDTAKTEYDRAVADKQRWEADLAAARARLAQAEAAQGQAEAALRAAEVALQEAFLRAPLTGVVCAKYVDPGAMVGPTTSVVSVEPMDELKFLVAVPAELLPRVAPGKTEVTLAIDAYPGRPFRSRIAKVHPNVDPVTRTATVEILTENERSQSGDYLLRPGMYATARVVIERKEKAVVVPMDALVRRTGKYSAFVVDGDTARSRPVELGIQSGPLVEITSGLVAGEELVVSGQHRLTDGTKVQRAASREGGGDRG